jgi:predicted metal-dependent phosphoesterase TrpH
LKSEKQGAFGEWLLCDFHIHSTFSDGELPLQYIVDLYGGKGFDAIAVTDHVLDSRTIEECRRSGIPIQALLEDDIPAYMEAVHRESRRAWEEYNMLVLPGIEVTNDHMKYHILGLDVEHSINPDLAVEDILKNIHTQGGVAVACHPHKRNGVDQQQSRHLWENRERFSDLFDAWEVANRDDLFNVVGLKKFRYIANSDFHAERHIYSWKTLLMCEKTPAAIKEAIRDNARVAIYLFRDIGAMPETISED